MNNPPKPSVTPNDTAREVQTVFHSTKEIDAKIDAYIMKNPRYWAFIQNAPRERLERLVVLNEIRELERQKRLRESLKK